MLRLRARSRLLRVARAQSDQCRCGTTGHPQPSASAQPSGPANTSELLSGWRCRRPRRDRLLCRHRATANRDAPTPRSWQSPLRGACHRGASADRRRIEEPSRSGSRRAGQPPPRPQRRKNPPWNQTRDHPRFRRSFGNGTWHSEPQRWAELLTQKTWHLLNATRWSRLTPRSPRNRLRSRASLARM